MSENGDFYLRGLTLLFQAAAAIGGYLLLWQFMRQRKIALRQSNLSMVERIVKEVSDEAEIFLKYPELRTYFYSDSKTIVASTIEVEESGDKYHRISAIAHKMLVGFAARIVLAREFPELYPIQSTELFIKKRLSDSLILRKNFLARQDDFPVTQNVLFRLVSEVEKTVDGRKSSVDSEHDESETS